MKKIVILVIFMCFLLSSLVYSQSQFGIPEEETKSAVQAEKDYTGMFTEIVLMDPETSEVVLVIPFDNGAPQSAGQSAVINISDSQNPTLKSFDSNRDPNQYPPPIASSGNCPSDLLTICHNGSVIVFGHYSNGNPRFIGRLSCDEPFGKIGITAKLSKFNGSIKYVTHYYEGQAFALTECNPRTGQIISQEVFPIP